MSEPVTAFLDALRDRFDLGMKHLTVAGGNQVHILAREDKMLDLIEYLAKECDARHAHQLAIDFGDKIEIVDVFLLNHLKTLAHVRRAVDTREKTVQSITGAFPSARWDEKFQAKFLGIDYALKDAAAPDAGAGTRVPWIKVELDNAVAKRGWPGESGIFDPKIDNVTYAWVKAQQTRVSGVKVQLGHHHRGIVDAVQRAAIDDVPFILSRACWGDANHLLLAHALAIESIARDACTVPHVATLWRALACELERLRSHQAFLATCFQLAGHQDVASGIVDAKRGLDAIDERLRALVQGKPFIVPGGISFDPFATGTLLPVPLRDSLALFEERFAGLVASRLERHDVFSRFHGIGPVSRRDAIRAGLTGPPARASGLHVDARRDFPYDAYKRGLLRWDTVTASGGDVMARIEIHAHETIQSLRIIFQLLPLLDEAPGTEAIIDPPAARGGEDAFSIVESARGELLVFARTAPDGKSIDTFRARVPSFTNFTAIEQVVGSCHARVLPAIVHSFNPCWACIDL